MTTITGTAMDSLTAHVEARIPGDAKLMLRSLCKVVAEAYPNKDSRMVAGHNVEILSPRKLS